MLQFEKVEEQGANILVIGVGGAGCNSVNRMIEDDLKGVDFLAVNTDAQALKTCRAENILQIGEKLTKGLGAGGNPEIGQRSAQESMEEIGRRIQGAEMVFITAGMGGGTGTGAAPIIAKIANELGVLTIGVVTKPFSFEGRKRADNAELGIKYLKKFVDSIVIVPNDKLLSVSNANTTFLDAFKMADDVLKKGVQGITDLIVESGMINLDFADVETVMRNRGVAHMGIGYGKGEDKVSDAVNSAVESPLLETTVAGAKAILLNITGGLDIGMMDINEASNQIHSVADRDAIIIFGAAVKEDMQDEMSITIIATGFENQPGNYAEPYAPEPDGSEEGEGSGEGAGEETAEDHLFDVTFGPANVSSEKGRRFTNTLKQLDEDKPESSSFDIPSFLK